MRSRRNKTTENAGLKSITDGEFGGIPIGTHVERVEV